MQARFANPEAVSRRAGGALGAAKKGMARRERMP
jgi:hypothetical protein